MDKEERIKQILKIREEVDHVFERAEETVNNLLISSLRRIDDDTAFMNDEEKRVYLQGLWKGYKLQLPMYDVRNTSSLKSLIGRLWNADNVPYRKDENGSPMIREDQPKEEKYHFLLWNQMILLRQIRYLESYLESKKIQKRGISQTLSCMLVIYKIFNYQVKEWDRSNDKELYSPVAIIAPFWIDDFQSFHQDVINRGSTDPAIRSTLKKIHEIAVKCLDFYKKKIEPILDQKPDQSVKRIMKRIRVDSDNDLRWIIQSNQDAVQEFDDNQCVQHLHLDDMAYQASAVTDFVGQILQGVSGNQKSQSGKEPAYNSLSEAFKEVSEYREIMNLLKAKGHCSSDFTWQDQKKGSLSLLAALIKWFASNGYCKKTRLSTEEIEAICQNTFKTKVGPSTIKHSKPEDAEILQFPPTPLT